ncbi:MAG TPA: NADH-quinone oxidoreductase subunit N, partial [Candidatus Dormibacteraeota bacterium]|nr:NADH-quinone oxidoreductase subunit N [Candidatus Dormibacteraeota bacterium]
MPMHIPFLSALIDYLQGDGRVILPEIELTLFGLGILLIDFTLSVKERYLNAGLALMGTAFSAYTVWKLRIPVAMGGSQFGFHDSVVIDPFFLFFAALFLAATALVILLSVKFLEIEQQQEGEYYALLLFACVGMMFMASGYDLIVMFLGLETMALSFYVLTGFLRREKRSNEASLKYVLLGAFSSGILAYGFSLLYGLSASTNIDNISIMLGRRNAFVSSLLHSPPSAPAEFDPFLLQLLPVLAFVLVAVGLFFKVAAVPFHQWAPDVYEGAPTPVTIFVSVASKTASFALLLRLFLVVFGATQVNWIYLVAGIAIASLTWGNLAALTQTNVKRLLAYSSISHVGYVLLALVAWDEKTKTLSETAKTGIAFYLFAYIFMTAG